VVVEAVAQALLVQFLMVVTDLQVPLQEHLLLTLAVAVQAVIQLLALAVQVVGAMVPLTQICLQPEGPTLAAVEVEVANQTHIQVFKLLEVALVVAGLLLFLTQTPMLT
jgi:hypothetical protein